MAINFKDPLWMTAWLDAALDKEKEKHRRVRCSGTSVSGHEAAQAWGSVVAGYFLVEESVKALLHVRGKDVPAKQLADDVVRGTRSG